MVAELRLRLLRQVHDGGDELRLGGGVRLAVVPEPLGQPALEFGVLLGCCGTARR
jgi:hypothetical protein